MAEPYTLPDLPYDYGALEPYISGEIMELHHGTHHAGYVKGANIALDQLAEAQDRSRYDTIRMIEKDLAFHLSGHVNHHMFWQNLSPGGGDKPDGALATAIDEGFGSFDAFRAHFNAAALQMQGSGWAVLALHATGPPTGGRLLVTQVYDHQNNVTHGACPLLLLDMWEHAYYLQYRTGKAEYVEAFWHVVHWADVQARYQAVAEQLRPVP